LLVAIAIGPRAHLVAMSQLIFGLL
jgi:hypothetical protein